MSFYRAWRAAEMPSLRRLVLDRRISFLTLVCVVMKTCPSLEDLVVSSGIVSHTEDSFKQYLDSEDDGGHLSSGDKSKNNLLETFDSTWQEYERPLLKVLEALPMHQLQCVDIWGACASDIKKLVERQHRSLKDVRLRVLYRKEDEDGDPEYDGVEISGGFDLSRAYNFGSAVCSILASCSQLRTLDIRTRDDQVFDIRQLIAHPWVCKALRTLGIPVRIARECSDPRLLRHAEAEKRQAARQGRLLKRLQPMLQPNETPHDAQLSQGVEELEEWEQCEVVWMKYVGQLNQLRELALRDYTVMTDDEPVKCETLTWTLNRGLGYLKNMTLLEYLLLPVHPYLQDEREWMFMKQHWPRLRVIQIWSHLPETYLNRIHDFWPELTVK
ncbi:hypothetical protein BGZ73_002205 [Actinomortierella ambigua]|nr:hypothetical protein BGZ73_002205 [Actinomortierella ambigua]